VVDPDPVEQIAEGIVGQVFVELVVPVHGLVSRLCVSFFPTPLSIAGVLRKSSPARKIKKSWFLFFIEGLCGFLYVHYIKPLSFPTITLIF
jgi:hypothetical protein